jgi:lipopolysaccharide transport system ATP-binding protein
MEDVGKEGRTVIFVSHNMGAIATLCDTGIFLEQGELKLYGEVEMAIKQYLSSGSNKCSNTYICDSGDSTAMLRIINIIDVDGLGPTLLDVDTVFGIKFSFEVKKKADFLQPNILVSTLEGQKVFQSIAGGDFSQPNIYSAVVWIPKNLLNDGEYVVNCSLTTLNPVVIHSSVDVFIELLDKLDADTRGVYKGKMHGSMRPLLNWSYAVEKPSTAMLEAATYL